MEQLGTRRSMIWFPCTILIAAMLCMGGLIAPGWYHMHRHRPVQDAMDVAILRLAESVPAGLTDDQWAYCILWTWQLHSNYGSFSFIPTDELERIQRELDRRIDRGADLATINWFWDQYIQAYPPAARYDHWRPTAPANHAEFTAGSHGGNPLSVWRADYTRRLAEQHGGR